jgi:hypothetical protein
MRKLALKVFVVSIETSNNRDVAYSRGDLCGGVLGRCQAGKKLKLSKERLMVFR